MLPRLRLVHQYSTGCRYLNEYHRAYCELLLKETYWASTQTCSPGAAWRRVRNADSEIIVVLPTPRREQWNARNAQRYGQGGPDRQPFQRRPPPRHAILLVVERWHLGYSIHGRQLELRVRFGACVHRNWNLCLNKAWFFTQSSNIISLAVVLFVCVGTYLLFSACQLNIDDPERGTFHVLSKS